MEWCPQGIYCKGVSSNKCTTCVGNHFRSVIMTSLSFQLSYFELFQCASTCTILVVSYGYGNTAISDDWGDIYFMFCEVPFDLGCGQCVGTKILFLVRVLFECGGEKTKLWLLGENGCFLQIRGEIERERELPSYLSKLGPLEGADPWSFAIHSVIWEFLPSYFY
jgi:hypothetical protein